MFNQYGIKNSSLSRTVHLSYKSMDVNVKEDKKKMVWRSCSHNVVSLSQNFMIPKKFWRFVEWRRHSSGKFQGVTKGFLSYSRKWFQRFDAVGLAVCIRSLLSSFTRCPVSEMPQIHRWKSLVLMELVIPWQCAHFRGVRTLRRTVWGPRDAGRS